MKNKPNHFAVVDVETTGLNPYRSDRIVEVAVVLMIPGTGIVREFVTLVNPERDMGPTRIHGLTAGDVINAPRFSQIAAELADFVRGAVAIAGHNVRFDMAFLRSEYERFGMSIPIGTIIDTMRLAGGGSLFTCCSDHNITYDGQAHTAIYDARAAANLLDKLIAGNPDLLNYYKPFEPIDWPFLQTECAPLLQRESQHNRIYETPRYIQQLVERLPTESDDIKQTEGESEYKALLWNVLEDGRIEEAESDSLVNIALQCGLNYGQIKSIHLAYLSQLARIALADQRITDAERHELNMITQLLGFGLLSETQFNQLLEVSPSGVERMSSPRVEIDWTGQSICFTGECQCSIEGAYISREFAEKLAADRGFIVMPSVTKKLNILVVSDPNTQSGKAKKARRYGVRIIHEPVFWRMLGIAIE